jgi:protoporphyrin/coproporphyrin ferrochelatase
MKEDGITRAIAFSQYPQYSCTTTGSSMNHLWRELIRLNMESTFSWSVIDRWHSHPGFIAAVAKRIALGLQKFPVEERDKVIIVFSAHSIPMMIVNRGDPYTGEIASTVERVMSAIRHGVDVETSNGMKEKIAASTNSHILAWQSKVGFLPWMGPPTDKVLEGLGEHGHQNVLVVPIAFTSDHVETLFEIDLEYSEVAHKAGISNFLRAPSLNDEPLLTDAMADIVQTHFDKKASVESSQYSLNCARCVNPACRTILNPISPYEKRRDLNTKKMFWPSENIIQMLKKRLEPSP